MRAGCAPRVSGWVLRSAVLAGGKGGLQRAVMGARRPRWASQPTFTPRSLLRELLERRSARVVDPTRGSAGVAGAGPALQDPARRASDVDSAHPRQVVFRRGGMARAIGPRRSATGRPPDPEGVCPCVLRHVPPAGHARSGERSVGVCPATQAEAGARPVQSLRTRIGRGPGETEGYGRTPPVTGKPRSRAIWGLGAGGRERAQ